MRLQSNKSEHPATCTAPFGNTLMLFVLYASAYVSVI
jgi:hypothetical protein